MLSDENNKPKKIFGRIEWPLALLFGAIPVLMITAVLKNFSAVF